MTTCIHRTVLLAQASALTIALGMSASVARAQTATPPVESASPTQPQPTDRTPANTLDVKTASQAPTPQPDDGSGSGASAGGDIVVTATRVNRAGYTAPTPTIVVGTEQLEARGTTNIAQYLDEVPAFRATTQPSSNGVNQRSVGSNYVDLRGLGTSRTLVLVDGQRFVPEMAAGLAGYNVNLNQIPALLVDKVEIVTGGASAQWGSDAVAGVVNILLKKKFNGLQAEVQSGISTYGDDASVRAGLLAGHNFADNRANVTFAVDYENNEGVGDVNTRAWGRQHTYLIPNPCPNSVAVSTACPTGGNGLATNLILPDVQFSGYAPGGVITNTAARGTTFNAAGNPVPFVYGQYVSGTSMQGGGQPGINYANIQPIAAPFHRVQTYARGNYALSDAVEAHVEGSYSFSSGGGIGQPYLSTTTIRSDNAYLPAATKAALGTATSFTLGRYNQEFVAQGHVTNETIRAVGGLDGSFGGGGGWKWSVNAGYGINKYRQRVDNSTITARFAFASDAVVSGGRIVCRATIPGPSFNAAAAGCVPVDLFGPGSITPAAAAYFNGTASDDIAYRQFFTNAQISGEPFNTWAGPVSVAVGGEYRHESEDAVADAIGNANGYNGNNASSFSGTYTVKEVFGEVVVPLLKDSVVGKSLDLNGAVRYADYGGSVNGQTTWKVGVTYTPVTGLLIRAARSRDIRAPNIFERNVPASGRNAVVNYGTSTAAVLTFTQGNPALQPEKADTTTYGISYQPPFVPGLAFSVDRFHIDTSGLIAQLGAQDVVDLCRVGQQASYCNLITFTGALPSGILLPFLNLASVKLRGIDLQANYRLPLSRLSAGARGALQFGFSGSINEKVAVNSGALGAVTIDRSGETGPKNQFAVPRFRSTTSISYSDSRFTLGAEARYISRSNYDNTFTAATINNNIIPAVTYVDLNATIDVSKRFALFTVVTNLFDKDPPPAPTDNASPTNAVYYDTIGRVIKVGVRVKM